MMRAVCRAIVRLSARLAPRSMRSRWREEWLAEIEAARTTRTRLAARAAGAPLDALLLHWTPSTHMSVRNGWTADVRDAWRALAKTPLQTATMIACLAVGAALMVAVFAAGNALVAGEQPGIRDRASLHFVERRMPGGRLHPITAGQFVNTDWSALPPSILSVGSEMPAHVDVVIDGLPQRVLASHVTGGFFTTLGTTPALGRLLAPGDDAPGAAPVVVISHSFWRRNFAGDADIVGRPLKLSSGFAHIVGVAPAGFVGTEIGDLGSVDADQEELWLPLHLEDLTRRGRASFDAVGPRTVVRLAPGITPAAAESQLEILVSMWRSAGLQGNTRAMAVLPFRFAELDEDTNLVAAFFGLLLLIPTIILMIGAANVAGLQAARAAWRAHEFAIRSSLGATRARLARLLGMETVLLAIAATAAAWLIATAALRYGAGLLPFTATPDWRVLLFALGIPIAVTLLIGVVPSWRASGIDVLAGLKLGTRGGGRESSRLRRLIVSAQIALSVALVLSALVLARTVATGPMALAHARSDVVVAGFYLTSPPEIDRRPAVQALMRGLAAIAGPSEIAFSSGEVRWSGTAYLGEDPPKPGDPAVLSRMSNFVGARAATRPIFGLLGVRLLEGRLFDENEPSVMVVNETFARRFTAQGPVVGTTHLVTPAGLLLVNASGKWVDATGVHSMRPRRVIGIVSDSFESDRRGVNQPLVYLPMDLSEVQSFSVFMRPPNVADAQRRIRELAATIAPIRAPQPLGTIASITQDRFRSHAWIGNALGYAGSLALLLACVGLFGLVSSSVAQRRHEYAVRVALGADRRTIVRLVVLEVAKLTALGFAAGFVLAVPAWIIIRDDVGRHATMFDPQAITMVLTALTIAAALAAFFPARRAGSADPLTAIRGD